MKKINKHIHFAISKTAFLSSRYLHSGHRSGKVLVLSLILLLFSACAPENPLSVSGEVVFQKYIRHSGQDIPKKVREAADGGFFVLGNFVEPGLTGSFFFVVKTDANGNKLWEIKGGIEDSTNYYFGNDLLLPSTGGFLVAGEFGVEADSTQMFLEKFTDSGNSEWKIAIISPPGSKANGIIETLDGNYLLLGTSPIENGDINIQLISPEGVLTAQDTFGTGNMEQGIGLAQAPGGDIILLTNRENSSSLSLQDYYLIKTDTNLGSNGGPFYDFGEVDDSWLNANEQAQFIRHDVANNFIIGGYSESPSSSFVKRSLIFKLEIGSTTANVLWSYPGPTGTTAQSIFPTLQGGYLLVGDTIVSKTDTEIYLTELNSEGEAIYARSYGAPNAIDSGTDVIVTAAGEWIVLGATTFGGDQDILLMKISK